MISDMLNILPRELILKIYNYLSKQELCSLRQTSRLFQDSTLFSFLARLKSETVIDIIASDLSVFFLKKNGTVLVCGDNHGGGLGIKGPNYAYTTPQPGPKLPKIKKIVSEHFHTFFLTKKGEVYACGQLKEGEGVNQRGWLGISTLECHGNLIFEPRVVSLPRLAKDIIISNCTTFFLLEDNSVFACGVNVWHQLGIGDAPYYDIPTETSLRDVKKIVASELNTFFILQDGSVKVCGKNSHGCLGIGHDLPQLEPVQLKGLPPISNIVTDDTNTFFISANGEAFFSGRNLSAEGGVGDNLSRIMPTLVPLPDKVKQIHQRLLFSLFLLENNQVYTSGWAGRSRDFSEERFILHPACVASNIKNTVSKQGRDILFINQDDQVFVSSLCNQEDLMTIYASAEQVDLLGKAKQVVDSQYRTFYLLENNTVYFNGSPIGDWSLACTACNDIAIPTGINEINQSQLLLQQIEAALTLAEKENNEEIAQASIKFSNE